MYKLLENMRKEKNRVTSEKGRVNQVRKPAGFGGFRGQPAGLEV